MYKFNALAETIFKMKYAMYEGETWINCCRRVITNVMAAIGYSDEDIEVTKLIELMNDRKFIPAGRILYATGRKMHQTSNCVSLGVEDSREGWSNLLHKASMSLMTGAGIGIEYSKIRPKGSKINKTGGIASGPVALMKMVNECARYIQQGGSRRSAVWAGLNWQHRDIGEFLTSKNWNEDIKKLKGKDFNFPAPLDMTNISVGLDDNFFTDYTEGGSHSGMLYNQLLRQMCETGEPGISVNIGENHDWIYRNACQPGFATLLTPLGIRTFDDIKEGDIIWTGTQWSPIKKKWCNGERLVHKYTTTSGTFVGTYDHKVFVKGKRMEANDAEGIDSCRGPQIENCIFNPQDIMDGLVIGDGSKHKGSNDLIYLIIGAKDKDYYDSSIKHLLLRDRTRGLGKAPSSIEAWEVCTTIKADELDRTYQRVIPERFYQGSISTKVGFLLGLFSANGCVTAGRVNLRASSKILIYQVADMLSSLGIKSSIGKGKSTKVKFSNGEYECKESYNLNIYSNSRPFFDFEPEVKYNY